MKTRLRSQSGCSDGASCPGWDYIAHGQADIGSICGLRRGTGVGNDGFETVVLRALSLRAKCAGSDLRMQERLTCTMCPMTG